MVFAWLWAEAVAWTRWGGWMAGWATPEVTRLLNLRAWVHPNDAVCPMVCAFVWAMLQSAGPIRPEAVDAAVIAVRQHRATLGVVAADPSAAPGAHTALITALAHATLLQALDIDPDEAAATLNPLYRALVAAAQHHPEHPTIRTLIERIQVLQAYLVTRTADADVVWIRARCQRIIDDPEDVVSLRILAQAARVVGHLAEQ